MENVETMYRVKLELGDPCGDGHGQRTDVRMKSNYDAVTIWQAYEKSCDLTSVRFDSSYGLYDAIWSEYGDCDIDDEVLEILQSYGIDIHRHEEYETLLLDGEEMWDDEFAFATKLIMQFIALSMPSNWVYVIEDRDEYETINSRQIGYGLFQ